MTETLATAARTASSGTDIRTRRRGALSDRWRKSQSVAAHRVGARRTTTRRDGSTAPITSEASAKSAVAVTAPAAMERSRWRGTRAAPATVADDEREGGADPGDVPEGALGGELQALLETEEDQRDHGQLGQGGGEAAPAGRSAPLPR
jgi:hypothetical protein